MTDTLEWLTIEEAAWRLASDEERNRRGKGPPVIVSFSDEEALARRELETSVANRLQTVLLNAEAQSRATELNGEQSRLPASFWRNWEIQASSLYEWSVCRRDAQKSDSFPGIIDIGVPPEWIDLSPAVHRIMTEQERNRRAALSGEAKGLELALSKLPRILNWIDDGVSDPPRDANRESFNTQIKTINQEWAQIARDAAERLRQLLLKTAAEAWEFDKREEPVTRLKPDFWNRYSIIEFSNGFRVVEAENSRKFYDGRIKIAFGHVEVQDEGTVTRAPQRKTPDPPPKAKGRPGAPKGARAHNWQLAIDNIVRLIRSGSARGIADAIRDPSTERLIPWAGNPCPSEESPTDPKNLEDTQREQLKKKFRKLHPDWGTYKPKPSGR